MIAFSKKTRFTEDFETIDALLALQMLEDQEQGQEQEFFRLTGTIQQFGATGSEIETALPELLKTKRERALYDALMALVTASRHSARFRMHTQTRAGMECEA
jgi:hypothetical protein